MSEVMLHGVLNMPPELWNNDSPIDVSQRHSRYVEASKRIYELEEQLQQAQEYADRLVEHKDMVCLPADLKNLRKANAAFASELAAVTEQRDRLAEALRQIKSELGVPQPEYPAPIANAVKIADEAIAAVEGGSDE